MTSKEIVEIKTLCLQLAIETYSYTIRGAEIFNAETGKVVIDVAKAFENYFGIATAEDK